jgi:hypothetical protein
MSGLWLYKDLRMNIDFFIVGSQRCGTTWVDVALRSTGKVFLPKGKQTYFFDRNYKKGLSWYLNHFDLDAVSSYEVIGEVATGYCLDGAIDRLAENFPNSKIILMARDPISRAYSNYKKRKDDYAGLTFELALAHDKDLIDRGLYGPMLARMYKLFPKENIKVVFYDDLQDDPRKFIQNIISFLNIDASVDEKLFGQNVNSSMFERVSRFTKKYKIYFLISIAKKIGLKSVARKIIYIFSHSRKKTRHRDFEKLRKYFTKSNSEFRDLTGHELKKWQ